jgi:transcription initiation factor TFIID subunit 8
MLNARRSLATPLDFKYALARFSLPLASIELHLKPPIPASKLHLQLENLPEQRLDADSTNVLLGEDLSGEPDKKSKPYVPKLFPSFPSKHTYKWSEKPPARETDPRKVREQAAKEARHGEEALRHIHNIEKAAKEKSVKKVASKAPKSKERHELWENMTDSFMADKRHSQLVKGDEGEDRSMIVNSEQHYWRQGASAKKNPPADLSNEI